MSTKFVTKGKNAGDNQTQDKTDIQNTDRGKTRLSSNQGKTIKNETHNATVQKALTARSRLLKMN